MRVYKMTNMNHGYGPITTNADDCITEIEEEMDESGEDIINGYTKENLPKFRKSLESLPMASNINDATAIGVFGPYMVVAEEMTQEEYDSLPEFEGY